MACLFIYLFIFLEGVGGPAFFSGKNGLLRESITVEETKA